MILYATPYSDNKKLIESYNDIWNRVGDDDYAVALDGDAMFTTRTFGHQIAETMRANEQYDVFTCMTNRVANRSQIVHGAWESNDMHYHRELGDKRWDDWHTRVEDITNASPLSGVLIAMKGRTWRKLYEKLKHTEWIMLGFDNDIHIQARDAGMKVGLMKGIYVMHYYRNGNKLDKAHLI